MANPTLLIGDYHMRDDFPFYQAHQKLLPWLLEFEVSDVFLLGDIFHRPTPSPVEYSSVIYFINSLLEKEGTKVYILNGNHDYNRVNRQFSTSVFKNWDDNRVQVIKEPRVIKDQSGNAYFCLPWMPDTHSKIRKEAGLSTFEEYVTRYIPENFKQEIIHSDFLLYHFPDETVYFGPESDGGIDLSPFEEINPKIIRKAGDIHIPDDHYVGPLFPTRIDEYGYQNKIVKVSINQLVEYIPVPQVLNFKTVDYAANPEDELEKDGLYLLEVRGTGTSEAMKKWNISDVSRVRKVTNTQSDESEATEDSEIEVSNLINLFFREKEIKGSVRDYIKKVLQEAGEPVKN